MPLRHPEPSILTHHRKKLRHPEHREGSPDRGRDSSRSSKRRRIFIRKTSILIGRVCKMDHVLAVRHL